MTDSQPTSKKVSRPKPSDRITDDEYLARLKSKCIVTESGCWEKQGFRSISKGMEHHGPARGYGHMYYRGVSWASHRLAWLLTRGLIPAGMKVMHKCDNPPCCNPAHLLEGTIQKNNADMANKMRAVKPPTKKWCEKHPKTPENMKPNGPGKWTCRACAKERQRRAYHQS
jgi:hypothetical protein